MLKLFKGLSVRELMLWLFSAGMILLSSIVFRGSDPFTVAASLVGVTALIFIAKGNVLGQILTIVFSIMYAVISCQYRYYGEMITYVGMTLPAAAAATVSWLRHPYDGAAEVEVAALGKIHRVTLPLTAVAATVAFYFILKYFNTANLEISTISITTSFAACYFLIFRSPFYAVAYAANDVVLIALWMLAAADNIAYVPMVICFAMFLINDLYGFYNWRRMKQRQADN